MKRIADGIYLRLDRHEKDLASGKDHAGWYSSMPLTDVIVFMRSLLDDRTHAR